MRHGDNRHPSLLVERRRLRLPSRGGGVSYFPVTPVHQMLRLLKAYWLHGAAVVVIAAFVGAVVYLALTLLSEPVPRPPSARPMADDPLAFRADTSGIASSRRFASCRP